MVTVLGQNNNGPWMTVGRKRRGDGTQGRPRMSKTGKEREAGFGKVAEDEACLTARGRRCQ